MTKYLIYQVNESIIKHLMYFVISNTPSPTPLACEYGLGSMLSSVSLRVSLAASP